MSWWGRMVLIALGAFTLMWRLAFIGWLGLVGRRQGERWDRESSRAIAVAWGPLMFFGISCVIVGAWPGARDLLYGAGGVLILGMGLGWWYRRRLER